MSARKKEIRRKFREGVFERDNHCCKKCGKPAVDAHHIIDRNELPNGGYVLENGISLCGTCHLLAESFHRSGKTVQGYSPNELFFLIGSSSWTAKTADLKMI